MNRKRLLEYIADRTTTLAAIERELLARGYAQEQVDDVLALIVVYREELAKYRPLSDADGLKITH
jgi:hypothetical protein